MTKTEQATEQQDATAAAGESGGNSAGRAAAGADGHGAAPGDNNTAAAGENSAANGETTAATANDNAAANGETTAATAADNAAANGETTAATGGDSNAAAIDADGGNATAGDRNATNGETAAAVADSAAAAVDEFAVLAQENQRLEQQAQENLDKALRITAEMDNLRKRTARDMENAHKYALERFVKELLPVADSMERGIDAAAEADAAALREGMELTLKMFFDCLDKFGVRPIEPLGEKFDPEWHEAVSMQDSKDHKAGLVMEVMQKGYELNGRLLRPAMVVVAK